MKSRTWFWSTTLGYIVATLSSAGLVPSAHAASPIPDPCKLIAVTELEQIVGPLKGAPKSGDIEAGDVSCEYKPSSGPAWIDLRLQEGTLSYWKNRNGGSNPVPLPQLSPDAFVNPDADGSAELYMQSGGYVVRISMPKAPTAIGQLKAIAEKARPRL